MRLWILLTSSDTSLGREQNGEGHPPPDSPDCQLGVEVKVPSEPPRTPLWLGGVEMPNYCSSLWPLQILGGCLLVVMNFLPSPGPLLIPPSGDGERCHVTAVGIGGPGSPHCLH